MYAKFLLILAVLGLTSCGGFNKLRKSNDPDLKYTKALEYFEAGKYNRSAILLQDIAGVYGGSSKGDTIAYYFGTSLYKQGDFYTSGEVFREFRSYYGRSPFLEDAEYMYAKGLYYQSPRPERDQTNTQMALLAINDYLNRYPNSVKADALKENQQELQQKLYDKSLNNARLYYDIGYYRSAVTALKSALDDYPQSNHRELISYLVVRSYYMYARNSVDEKQRQRYLDMQDAYYSFMAEFPESTYNRDVEKMNNEAKRYLAQYQDTEEGDDVSGYLSAKELRRAERQKRRELKQEDLMITNLGTSKDRSSKRRSAKKEVKKDQLNNENGNQEE